MLLDTMTNKSTQRDTFCVLVCVGGYVGVWVCVHYIIELANNVDGQDT